MDDSKVTKLAEDVVEIKVSLAKQEANLDNQTKILDRLTESVEEHVRRSNAIEEMLEQVRQETSAKIESEIKPIKNHIHFVKGAVWALGIVAAIVGGLYKAGILQKFL